MAQQTYNPYATRNKYREVKTPWGFNTTLHEDDPYWNAGALIGTILGGNYNQRGADKSKETANRMYEKYLESFKNEGSVSDKLYQQGKDANAISLGDTNVGASLEPVSNKQPQNNSAISANADNVPVQRDIVAEKFDMLRSNYAQDDNPETNKRQMQGFVDTTKQTITNANPLQMPEFDSNVIKNRIVAQLKKDGRSEWQIQQALDQLEPTLKDKQGEFNRTNIYKYSQLMQDALDKGNLIDAAIYNAKITNFDPNIGKALSYGLLSKQKTDQMQQAFDYKYKLAKANNWSDEASMRYAFSNETPWDRNDKDRQYNLAAYKIANAGAGSKKAGGLTPSQMLEQYKQADKELKDLEEQVSLINKDTPAEVQAELKNKYNKAYYSRNALYDMIYGGYQPAPKETTENKLNSNYESIINYATYMFNQGATKEQVANDLINQLGDSDYLRGIIAEFG